MNNNFEISKVNWELTFGPDIDMPQGQVSLILMRQNIMEQKNFLKKIFCHYIQMEHNFQG